MTATPGTSPAAYRTLASLAKGVLGEGYVPEVPGRMLASISHLPSGRERDTLVGALKAMDTRAGALLFTGRPVPVSWLTQPEAESLIDRLRSSPLPPQRALGRALLGLALTSLYGHPGSEWERIGYGGPLGPAPDEPRRLHTLRLEGDEELSCDVVIVGSGAGGGCAAGILAARGLDVVVLEKGGYHAEADFHHSEPQAMQDLYLYGGALTTTDLGCQILAGSTLGGGTVVNYTTSFRTPEPVLRQWRDVSGIDDFLSDDFQRSLNEVAARLGVNTDSSAAGRRDELLEEGLKKLGWHVDGMPRNVKGCTQDESCGYCGFGCRNGAKQSSMRTYLEDAARHGARIVVGADVRRVAISYGRATGVEAVVGPHRLTVRARAVVVSGGAIESPALLLRSGLRGQVGRNLHLHPGSATWGTFDEDVRMWEGTLQARYSSELRSSEGFYGPIFETVPVHPGYGSAAVPWLSAADHRRRMGDYSKISFCAVLPRDKSAGRIRLGRDGGPRAVYRLGADDQRRILEGQIAAARVLEAAGAKEIYSSHRVPIAYEPGRPGAHERWAEKVREIGVDPRVTPYFSYHQMSSCRMGVDPASSAVGPDNECHEVKDLFVMDASAFPAASGVNPMLSIYGIANRAAQKLADRLSR